MTAGWSWLTARHAGAVCVWGGGGQGQNACVYLGSRMGRPVAHAAAACLQCVLHSVFDFACIMGDLQQRCGIRQSCVRSCVAIRQQLPGRELWVIDTCLYRRGGGGASQAQSESTHVWLQRGGRLYKIGNGLCGQLCVLVAVPPTAEYRGVCTWEQCCCQCQGP